MHNATQATFDAAIESVRVGTVFAHNAKAYGSWARGRKAKSSRGLVGHDLERAVGAMVLTHPEYIVEGAR